MGNKTNITLAEWMITNLGEDSIEKYWSEKNEISPHDITYGSKKNVWFKCQNTNYHDDYDMKPNSFTNGSRCPFCSRQRVHPTDSFANWGINQFGDDFLENYWDFNANIDLNPWKLSPYGKQKAYFICQNKDYHPSYRINIYGFRQGMRCSCCSPSGGKIHFKDSLGSLHPEVIEIWSDKNKKSPYEYAPKSEVDIYWKCGISIHDDYKRNIKCSNNSNFNCPQCSTERKESFLQEKVRLFLTKELNYTLLHENFCSLRCINPITNYPLPYDNEVIINEKIRLIIEVNGVQHYKITSWAKEMANKKRIEPLEELKYTQWKDQHKMEYALSKGYYYLAIPYWTDNEVEEWKSIIIEKLKVINSIKGEW